MLQLGRFILLVAGILVAGTTGSGLADEIVILGNDTKPPKIYQEDGEARGILVDIMLWVEANLDHTFEIQLTPWKRAYENALNGRGGIMGLSKNAERLELFDYSDVMYTDMILLVVLKGQEFPYHGVEDLKGKIVGIQRGSNYGETFEEAKRYCMIDLDNAGEQRLLKLLAGRIDVALIGPGRAGLQAVIQRNAKLLANQDEFVVIDQPFAEDPNYLGFAKSMNMEAFLAEFDRALSEGWQSGEIQRIIDRHGRALRLNEAQDKPRGDGGGGDHR